MVLSRSEPWVSAATYRPRALFERRHELECALQRALAHLALELRQERVDLGRVVRVRLLAHGGCGAAPALGHVMLPAHVPPDTMVDPKTLKLVALGNPLLDMQIRDGEAVLEKYGLKSNDAVLANEQQLSIYQYIVENYQVTYVAGGAAQNTARAVQYVLPEHSTAYIGAVGKDDLAQQLRAANEREGLESLYQVVDSVPTGSCAVVITGHDRSLCTNLGAAEKFNKSHLDTPEVKAAIEAAPFFYVGGFFLTHGVESAVAVAKHAKEAGKSFAFNLSAPFIPQFFKAQVDQVLPYAELVIGNESEAEAWAQASNLETRDLHQIAQAIANSPSEISKPRTVLITHGSQATVRAVQNGSQTFTHDTPKIDAKDIVDSNGAGDAFAGGVISGLLLGKPIEEAVDIGHRLGGMCIGQVGPVLKFRTYTAPLTPSEGVCRVNAAAVRVQPRRYDPRIRSHFLSQATIVRPIPQGACAPARPPRA